MADVIRCGGWPNHDTYYRWRRRLPTYFLWLSAANLLEIEAIMRHIMALNSADIIDRYERARCEPECEDQKHRGFLNNRLTITRILGRHRWFWVKVLVFNRKQLHVWCGGPSPLGLDYLEPPHDQPVEDLAIDEDPAIDAGIDDGPDGGGE